jgi:hypothetical protein
VTADRVTWWTLRPRERGERRETPAPVCKVLWHSLSRPKIMGPVRFTRLTLRWLRDRDGRSDFKKGSPSFTLGYGDLGSLGYRRPQRADLGIVIWLLPVTIVPASSSVSGRSPCEGNVRYVRRVATRTLCP